MWFFGTIKKPTRPGGLIYELYTINRKKKVEIDILLKQGMSMRKVGSVLGISHSTISRYKAGIYIKRKIDINTKYSVFLNYLYSHYDRRNKSIEVCIYMFKKRYKGAICPSIKQVYNWINEGKISINKNNMCYKRRKNKITSGMMTHTKWNLDNKTVLPISLRPKYINKRDEPGHLEIDSILGKKNEQDSLISIVDRCTRRLWLIKSNYKNEYYTANLIYN